MKHLLAIALLSLTSTAFAGVVPPAEREPLFKEILQKFWGQARTPDGAVIQPTSEEDRRTMPVNMAVANFAFDMGELSGTAQWCGVDWRQNFSALTRQARKNNQTEKQVAFIAVVHGAAQSVVSSALAKAAKCSPEAQSRVKSQIESVLAKEPK